MAPMPSAESGIARTWGRTPAERAAPYPCDPLLPRADETLFRALDVAAPAPLLFRWLCQLRAAPYSYDWLDNVVRWSPRRLTRGSDDLAPGQRVMVIFLLAAFARDEHLTLTLGGPTTSLFGEAAITYRVVVKLLIRYPFWGRWRAARALFARGDLIMMRKQLRTIGGLAERIARREVATRHCPTAQHGHDRP